MLPGLSSYKSTRLANNLAYIIVARQSYNSTTGSHVLRYAYDTSFDRDNHMKTPETTQQPVQQPEQILATSLQDISEDLRATFAAYHDVLDADPNRDYNAMVALGALENLCRLLHAEAATAVEPDV